MKYLVKFFKFLTFLIVLTINNELFSQDETICFTYPYKNKTYDGIYLNLNQFLENNPIPRSKIMSPYDPERFDYFEKVLSGENVEFVDRTGIIRSFPKKRIWGYANNRNIYVNLKNQFNPIIHLGCICLVIIEESAFKLSNIQLLGGSYGTIYLAIPIYAQKKHSIFIYALESVKLFNYNTASIKLLLADDNELFEEYNNLTKRNQEKLIFKYINCYNTRHPLPIKESYKYRLRK